MCYPAQLCSALAFPASNLSCFVCLRAVTPALSHISHSSRCPPFAVSATPDRPDLSCENVCKRGALALGRGRRAVSTPHSPGEGYIKQMPIILSLNGSYLSSPRESPTQESVSLKNACDNGCESLRWVSSRSSFACLSRARTRAYPSPSPFSFPSPLSHLRSITPSAPVVSFTERSVQQPELEHYR